MGPLQPPQKRRRLLRQLQGVTLPPGLAPPPGVVIVPLDTDPPTQQPSTTAPTAAPVTGAPQTAFPTFSRTTSRPTNVPTITAPTVLPSSSPSDAPSLPPANNGTALATRSSSDNNARDNSVWLYPFVLSSLVAVAVVLLICCCIVRRKMAQKKKDEEEEDYMLGVHPARKNYSVRFTLPEDDRGTDDENSSSSSSSKSSGSSSSSAQSQSTASKEPERTVAASPLMAKPPPAEKNTDRTMAAHEDHSWGSEEQGSHRSTHGEAHDAREWGSEQTVKSPAERRAEKEQFRRAKAALERKEQEKKRKQEELKRKQQAAAKKRREEALRAKLKAEIAALEKQMEDKKKALGIREEKTAPEEKEELFEDEYSVSKRDGSIRSLGHSSNDNTSRAPSVVPQDDNHNQQNRYFLSNEKDTRANPATDATDYASYGVDAGPSGRKPKSALLREIEQVQSESSTFLAQNKAPDGSTRSERSRKSHESLGEQSATSKSEKDVEVNPQRDFVSYGLERQSHAEPEQRNTKLRSDSSAKSHQSRSSEASQKTPPTETSQRSVTSSSEHRPNPASRSGENRPSNRSDQRKPPIQNPRQQGTTQQPSSEQRRPPNSSSRTAPKVVRRPPNQGRDPHHQHPYPHQSQGPYGMEQPPPNQYAYYGYGPYGPPPYNPYYAQANGADQQGPHPHSQQPYGYAPPPHQPPYNPNYYPPHHMGPPPNQQPYYDPHASHPPPHYARAPPLNRRPEQERVRPPNRGIPPNSTPDVVHLHHQSDEESTSNLGDQSTRPTLEASQRTNSTSQRRLSRSSHSSYEPYTKDGIVGFKVKQIRQDEEENEKLTPGRNQVVRTNSGSSQRSAGRLPMRRNSNRKRYQDPQRQQQEDERINNMSSRSPSDGSESDAPSHQSSDESSATNDGSEYDEENMITAEEQQTHYAHGQNAHASYYAPDYPTMDAEHVQYRADEEDQTNSTNRSERSQGRGLVSSHSRTSNVSSTGGRGRAPVVETVDSNSSSTEYEPEEASKPAMSSTHSGRSDPGAPTPEREVARVQAPRMDYNRIGSNRRMSGSGNDGTSSSGSQNFSRDEAERSPSYAPQIHDSSSANANDNSIYSGDNEPTSPPMINRSISFGSSSSDSTGNTGDSESPRPDKQMNVSTSYETSSASGHSPPSPAPGIRPSVSTDSGVSTASDDYAAPVSPRQRKPSIGDNSHDTGTSFFEDSNQSFNHKVGEDKYNVDSPEGVEDHEIILARIREHDMKRAEYQEKMARHFSLSETDQYSKVYASGSDGSDPVHSAASLSSRSNDSIEVFSTDDEDDIGEMREVRRGRRRPMVNAASIPRNIGGLNEYISDKEEEEDTEIASGLSGKVNSTRNFIGAEKSLESGDYEEISATSGSWVEEEVFDEDL